MNQEQRSKKCIFSGIATALVNTLRFRGVLPVLSIGLSHHQPFDFMGILVHIQAC